MKRVAITQRQDYLHHHGEFRDSLDISWNYLLKEVGVMPIPVPNIFENEHEVNQWFKLFRPDGLILSGGNDIGKMKHRDKSELLTLNYLKKNLIPVVGICRGMQLMAVWAGADLTRVQGHVRTRHLVSFDHEDSREVNSFHNYQISGKMTDFRCVGHSEEGVIEKIIHKTLPWQGIMWHPERETPFDTCDINFLRDVFL
jgi:N5-(cytidine 5'-diphosphoramidyl)-L-glutamine hydrolase